ncbi:MAG: DUF3943 domain-containing protein [bacterium]|nr:DUF3943 domain-containing protein [bacterium]
MRVMLSVLVIALLLAEPSDAKSENKHFWRDNSIMYAGQWAFTFTINYGGLGKRFRKQASFKKFGRNFISLPEFKDGDSFATNYIAHPLVGAFTYYMFRKQGHSVKKSFCATALQSTLFEYTIEGFVERPSGVDLIVTPVIGAPLGAKMGKWILPASALMIIIRVTFL